VGAQRASSRGGHLPYQVMMTLTPCLSMGHCLRWRAIVARQDRCPGPVFGSIELSSSGSSRLARLAHAAPGEGKNIAESPASRQERGKLEAVESGCRERGAWRIEGRAWRPNKWTLCAWPALVSSAPGSAVEAGWIRDCRVEGEFKAGGDCFGGCHDLFQQGA